MAPHRQPEAVALLTLHAAMIADSLTPASPARMGAKWRGSALAWGCAARHASSSDRAGLAHCVDCGGGRSPAPATSVATAAGCDRAAPSPGRPAGARDARSPWRPDEPSGPVMLVATGQRRTGRVDHTSYNVPAATARVTSRRVRRAVASGN